MARTRKLEICVESVRAAVLAEEGGADRVELCRDLASDGLTPTDEQMAEARARVRLPIACMVRPRAGSFVHDEAELAEMERAIERAREHGMDAVVLGALDGNGGVDRRATERLVARAGDLPVVFHRAFDRVRDPFGSLEVLVELGVTRILTSGGARTALEGADVLAELVRRAGDRIEILAGGSVRADNLRELVERTNVLQVHTGLGGDAGIDRARMSELVTLMTTLG